MPGFTTEAILNMENPHKDLCSSTDSINENLSTLNKLTLDQQHALAIKIIENLSLEQIRGLNPVRSLAAPENFVEKLSKAMTIASKILAMADPKNKNAISSLLADKEMQDSNSPFRPLITTLGNRHADTIMKGLEKANPKQAHALHTCIPKIFSDTHVAASFQSLHEEAPISFNSKEEKGNPSGFFEEKGELRQRKGSKAVVSTPPEPQNLSGTKNGFLASMTSCFVPCI